MASPKSFLYLNAVFFAEKMSLSIPDIGQSRHPKTPRPVLTFLTVNSPLFNCQMSSSSDESLPTSAEGSISTSPSSVELDNKIDAKTEGDVVQLPVPFYPPSLVQADSNYGVDCLIPRRLPSTLNLPPVPNVKANVGIDKLDMYVSPLPLLLIVEVTNSLSGALLMLGFLDTQNLFG